MQHVAYLKNSIGLNRSLMLSFFWPSLPPPPTKTCLKHNRSLTIPPESRKSHTYGGNFLAKTRIKATARKEACLVHPSYNQHTIQSPVQPLLLSNIQFLTRHHVVASNQRRTNCVKRSKISLLPWTQTTRIPIENLNEANIFAFPCL